MTYVTAGFPTAAETVEVLLGMEAGGAGEKSNWLPLNIANRLHRCY